MITLVVLEQNALEAFPVKRPYASMREIVENVSRHFGCNVLAALHLAFSPHDREGCVLELLHKVLPN